MPQNYFGGIFHDPITLEIYYGLAQQLPTDSWEEDHETKLNKRQLISVYEHTYFNQHQNDTYRINRFERMANGIIRNLYTFSMKREEEQGIVIGEKAKELYSAISQERVTII